MNLFYFLILLSSIIFLLPIKDRRQRNMGFPWMTVTLVGLNILVYIGVMILYYQQPGSGEEVMMGLLYPYMEVPDLVLKGKGLGALSILTSGFLHAGPLHLVGNMLILLFFGRKVEDTTGPFRFLIFYLLCVYTSGLLSVVARGLFLSGDAHMPALGASGAIFGVMLAYFFLYSNERIMTLTLPIPWVFWVPVWLYIVRDLLVNAVVGELSQQAGTMLNSTNIFAHLGGAIGGLLFIYFFLHPDVLAQRR